MLSVRFIGRLATRQAAAATSRRSERVLKPAWVLAAFGVLALATSAAPASAAPPDHRLVFAKSVTVGADGNGVVGGLFAVEPRFRYAVEVTNGCATASGSCGEAGQEAAKTFTLELNGETLLTKDDGQESVYRVKLPRSALVTGEDNELILLAGGDPGSSVRVRIFAIPAKDTP